MSNEKTEDCMCTEEVLVLGCTIHDRVSRETSLEDIAPGDVVVWDYNVGGITGTLTPQPPERPDLELTIFEECKGECGDWDWDEPHYGEPCGLYFRAVDDMAREKYLIEAELAAEYWRATANLDEVNPDRYELEMDGKVEPIDMILWRFANLPHARSSDYK